MTQNEKEKTCREGGVKVMDYKLKIGLWNTMDKNTQIGHRVHPQNNATQHIFIEKVKMNTTQSSLLKVKLWGYSILN